MLRVSPMEREELANRMKALDIDEKEEVLKLFPTELILNEYRRREETVNRIYEELLNTLKHASSQNAMTLLEKEKFLYEVQKNLYGRRKDV